MQANLDSTETVQFYQDKIGPRLIHKERLNCDQLQLTSTYNVASANITNILLTRESLGKCRCPSFINVVILFVQTIDDDYVKPKKTASDIKESDFLISLAASNLAQDADDINDKW